MTFYSFVSSRQHRTSLFLLILLCSTACSKSSENQQLRIQPGEDVPDLQVTDLKSNPVTLKTASGKVLLINLWATWCAPCRQEMPSLDRLSGLLDETRYAVVGLSVDDDDHLVREFLIERKIYFQNYLDADSKIINEIIGVRALPSTFIISSEGKLLKVVEGAREWDSMEVLGEIKALANVSKP